jgi:exopolysaccharide biosynthesis polyprenyl glycosylphosphotransferase
MSPFRPSSYPPWPVMTSTVGGARKTLTATDLASARSDLLSAVAEPGSFPTPPKSINAKAWMLTAPVDAIALTIPAVLSPGHARAVVSMAVMCLAMLYSGGRYRARLHLSVLDELPTLLGRAFVAAAVVSAVTALRHPSLAVADFMRLAALSTALLLAGRCITNLIILSARSRRVVQHPTVLVGAGPLGLELVRLLRRYPQYGLNVVGYVDDRVSAVGDDADLADLPRLGRTDRLDAAIVQLNADVLLVADPARPDGTLLDIVRTPAAARCDLLVVPRLHEFHTQVGLVDHIGAIPIMRIRTPSLRGPAWAMKRLFDLVVCSILLIVLSPVLLAAAIAVRLEGGKGILFRQQRMTQDGRIFEVIKFRSMRPANEEDSRSTWSIASDRRVGRVGKMLRRTSLDELPQLWNIVRGDMTLVGPRPERPFFVEQFSAEHPRYAERHRVVCGLTGLAQVSGLRGDTPISDRARYDNFYIENWSLWLDAKVLIRTVSEVLGARGR